MVVLALLSIGLLALDAPAASADRIEAPCAGTSPETVAKQMRIYAKSGRFRAAQTHSGATIQIPPIRFTGPGRSSTLPIGPCQHIYRFRYRNLDSAEARRPFRYIEVDWNTEGLPRGPRESFVSPHFDFHFYLRSRRAVKRSTVCVSTNGATCDPFRTPYPQMRRFLNIPSPAFLPAGYAPDPGSSIPAMGLHILDRRFDYTVENVDHYPTLIYGSFDGKVLFAEASVTLATLQDAMAAPGHVRSYRYRQPAKVRGGIPWPTQFTIRYLPRSGGFRVGFTSFEH